MITKKSAFYEKLQNNIGRRNFLSVLFLGILVFLTAFLFKKDGGLMGAQKKSDTQLSSIAQLVTDPRFDVKGDGVTDDSNAIQSVINHVNSLSGGTVYFPKRTYICKNLVQPPNIVLEFAPGTVLKFPVGSGGTDRMIIVGAINGGSLPIDGSLYYYGIHGNGLVIDASNVDLSQTINGIFVSGATNFEIDGVTGNYFVQGYTVEVIQSYGSKVVYPSHGIIRNIRSYNQRTWGGAVALECGSNILIENIFCQIGTAVDCETDTDVASGIKSFQDLVIRNIQVDNGKAINLNPHQCSADNVTIQKVKAYNGACISLYYQTSSPAGRLSNVSIYDVWGDGANSADSGFDSPNGVVVTNLIVRNAHMQNYVSYGFKVNGGTWYDCIAQNNGLDGWRSTLQRRNKSVVARFYNCTANNNNRRNQVNISGFNIGNHGKLEFYSCTATDTRSTKLQWYGVYSSGTPVYTHKCMFNGNHAKRIGPKDGQSYDVMDYETFMEDKNGNVTPYFKVTITIGTFQTTINHDLNRIPSMVWIKPKGNATVWESATADNFNVYLTASTSVTCDILIF